MADMRFEEALAVLEQPVETSSLSALMHALAVITSDPGATLDQIMLGLRHAGIVQETAAISLHRRTGRRSDAGSGGIVTDESNWRAWLADRAASRPGAATVGG